MRPSFLFLLFQVTACLLAPLPGSAADPVNVSVHDWPWWRGPNRDGIASADQQPPLNWNKSKNLLWMVAVPGRGHASPTVCRDRIFLATADETLEVQSVLCYARQTGQLLWETKLHHGPLNPKNKKASQASSTIASDGEQVYVNFLNDGAVYTTALDRDGSQLWQRKVTDYIPHQGYGSSPAIYGSLVIVTADNKGGGALVAFDRKTGKEVWRHARPKTPNYPSPMILRAAGRDQLFLSGCNLVSGFDPVTGAKLWETDGATTECVTSTVTDGRLIFTSGGYPDNHVSAVHADGSGSLEWRNRVRVYVPSMIVHQGYLYAITDAGIAMCWRCDTGKEVWKSRLRGTFSASPVMVGQRIYATNEAATTYVLKVSPSDCEVLAENQLGDEAFATPTICHNRIYLRVAKYQGQQRQEFLCCVGGE